jgi:hypothetical protein
MVFKRMIIFKSQRDFFSGLMFSVVGVAFLVGAATTYDIGTTEQMGPGYFPLLVGSLMAFLGAVIMIKSFVMKTEGDGNIGAWAWKPMFFIIAANLAFGALLGGLPSIGFPAMGLIVAIYALTFIASLAGDEFEIKEVAILATILSVGSYLGFVVVLKLQFQVWPDFIIR